MKDRSVLGIILVLIGGAFLLDQFNIVSVGNIMSTYWPIILIVLGLIGLLDKRSSKTGGAVLLILGILFQARNLDLINVSIFRTFWPILLILAGIKIIFGKDKVFVHKEFESEPKHSRIKNEPINNSSSNSNDYINESGLFSEINTKVESHDFKGGTISSTMGQVKVDLRDVILHNNEATLNISVVMGEAKVYVPDNWKINYSGKPFMGEFNNRKKYSGEIDGPLLNINFSVFMGSISIE